MTLWLVASLLVLVPAGHAFTNLHAPRPIVDARAVRTSAAATDDSSTSSNSKAALLNLFGSPEDPVLACPVSKAPLAKVGRWLGGVARDVRECAATGKRYSSNGVYIDLVVQEEEGGFKIPILQRSLSELVQTDTFRNPAVAFAYERGWRSGFRNAGFPGIDIEFERLLEFFEPAFGGNVLDMSCGSGLMSRRLQKSGKFGRLVSADFSEVMLLETRRRFDEEKITVPDLLRCDVARLPLQSDVLDGVHAGAALHCWPRIELGLSEIHRALKPDGRFFATTFKKGAYGVPSPTNSQGRPTFRFFDVDELEDLLRDAGFSEVTVEVEGGGCLICKCVK